MSWVDSVPVVILCGGKSSRLGGPTPKPLCRVNGQPVIRHIMDFWNAERYILIVSPDLEAAIRDHPFIVSLKTQLYIAVQPEPRGIADAIACAQSVLPALPASRFVVALGDCVQRGTFAFPEDMVIGVGGHDDPGLESLRRSNLLLTDQNLLLTQTVEKPRLWNGMGSYFFDQRVFTYIKMLQPSGRGELEVTDLLQLMVDHEEPVHCVPFNGHYLNITYPADLAHAATLLS